MTIRYGPGFLPMVGRVFAATLTIAVCSAVLAQQPPDSSAGVSPSGQKEKSDIVTLQLGKPIERELAAGQRHTYEIAVSQGQFLRFEVRDISLDVGVVLHWPSGNAITPWNPVGTSFQTKPVSIVASETGTYQIDVYAGANSAGKYEIRVTDLRAATEQERALQEARDVYNEARRLSAQGRWADSVPLMLRCLEIRERVLGPDHPTVAATLINLAGDYSNLGDYARSERAYLRALKIKEKELGAENPDLAIDLVAIAQDYLERGDYLKAEESLRRGLAILEKANRVETGAGAAILESMGRIYYARADYSTASSFYDRGREVWIKLLGPDHFHLAHSFGLSGRAAYDAGDYAKAEAMFQRALALEQKGMRPEDPRIAEFSDDLAMLYCTTGEYSKGEELYQEALARFERAGALAHPLVQETLYGLARCLTANGKTPEATALQSRASELEEHYLSINLTAGSEREKQAFHDLFYSRGLRNISLHAQFAPEDPAALRLAVTTVLRQKGRVQDAVSASFSGLRQRLSPEDRKLIDDLDDLTSKLAKLVLNGPQKLPASEYETKIKALEKQREDLEATLSRRSAGFYEGSTPATLDGVEAAIPHDAALIEYAVYRPFNPKAPDNQSAYGKRRYVAYIIRNQGQVQWTDLGDAAAIDHAIDGLRQALRDPQRKDVRQVARALDRQVMQPVRALTGDAARLIISPDGELNLIPFEALVDERNHFIVEGYSITYVTTGRDLMRMQIARANKSGPLVLADPLFDDPQRAALHGAAPPRVRTIAAKRGTGSVSGDLHDIYFAPLRGTAEEARMIRQLFPNAQVLTGAGATKDALQKAVSPQILHIATHGFFLNDATVTRASGIAANPLLRSGLALSGANLIKTGNEDGILTALEASNLNLWGTRLVTLSACDTGLGEIKTGEGVYGLRRAFFESGAETLVMTLWPVNDYVTRQMITSYYAGLKNGLGRGEALRQAELAMMKRKGREHPFYWASFIQSGEWANLDGQR